MAAAAVVAAHAAPAAVAVVAVAAEDAVVAAVDVVDNMIGLGYRPELALYIDRNRDLQFVEVMAEDFHSPQCVPQALKNLRKRGVEILLHCTSLSLGGTERVSQKLIKHLKVLSNYFESPFVSDHVALVRAGGLESGHLLPVRRTEVMLDVLTRNIEEVKAGLDVPLVLENIATTFDWPAAEQEMDEAQFLSELLRRTDCRFLLDVSNLFANSFNHKYDAVELLDRMPLHRLAYVHMAGGTFKAGLYHDTHCHPLREQSLTLLAKLCERVSPPYVMLERDDDFAPSAELDGELAAISSVCKNTKVAVPLPAPANNDARRARVSAPRAQVLKTAVAAIKAEQAALLRALVVNIDDEHVLRKLDQDLLKQAHDSLLRKRLRTIKRACPYLQELFLDDDKLDIALRDFFNRTPSPSARGPYIDAMDFVLYVHDHPLRYEAAMRITKADLKIAKSADR